ncbi:MAG: deoxyribonuclease V [Gammaproteobacteria bacterium]|jgi:deoxyribonuclease V
MDTHYAHSWEVTPKEAIAIQRDLCRHVIRRLDFDPKPLRTAAGVDVGFEDNGRTTRAAVAVLDYATLKQVDCGIARLPTRFPYVPGLLSFRELPAVLKALARLQSQPDILLCDGQGIAHPRRLGIASHLGLLTGLPAIGVGKSRLIGRHGEVPAKRGAWTPLRDGEEVIGAVLRTREGVKPIYVSIGHRIDLDTAVAVVMACTGKYKLPETTRAAHRLASGPA